ncbi:hypothetical protein ACFSYH_08605 [Populibacterium corticicola]|uniref:Protein kinase domain-containing protein n=1 Tax=Populibacterium corticicola TaxID=1812826 RepID=A0ABW5XIF9_9MICO
MPRLEPGTTLVARYEVNTLETSPRIDVEKWRARDKIFGRDVNVYVLDDAIARGAINRAKETAQLSVEHIARIVDVIDKGSGQRYVITERPAGVTTAAAIAGSPFTTPQAKAVIGTIARSLVKAADTQGFRHGGITADSIYFHKNTAILTGLAPRNFLGLNEDISDDVLAFQDTRGLAALTYFMLTGLMPNYMTEESTPLPRLTGFLEDADEHLDRFTTDLLNGTETGIATPHDFLEALGAWSESDLPEVTEVSSPDEPQDPVPPVTSDPPKRTSARTGASASAPLPSTQPPAVVAGLGAASIGGAAAALAGSAELNAANPLAVTSSPDATAARESGRPPRFLPATNDITLGETTPPPAVPPPVPQEQAAPQAMEWSQPPTQPAKHGGFNPTPFILVLFLGAIVTGGVWAVNALTAPMDPVVVAPSGRPTNPAAEVTDEPTETEPTEDIILPVMKTAQALDPDGDGNEHPELQDRLIDGSTTQPWYSRTYRTAAFGGIAKSGIGVQIGLEEESTVTSVLISSANTGGKVEIRATSADDPGGGELLASGSMNGETMFRLEQPVKTDSIVIWFTELPSDDTGKFRAYIYEVTIT